MASVAKRADGRWRARYRDDTGKEHAKHFDKKNDAQRWLNEVTTSLVTGQYVDPRAGRITLDTYSRSWEATQVGRANTVGKVDNALRLHIRPALGARPMAAIRHSDVQGFVKRLSDTYSPGQVRNVHGVLVRLFESAVLDRVVPVSPCQKIQMPKPTGGEVTPPTKAEIQRAIETAPDRYKALVVFLAGSGLRIGEALGLRVADVDFLRRTVRVERQRLQNGSVGEPKTERSKRTVPLAQVVLDQLAAHLAAFPSDEWLFTAPDGGPLSYNTTWKWVWSKIQKTARIDCTTHDLRHFCASGLIAGGNSVKQVQQVLGHSSAAITLQVYAHLWPGDDDKTRAIMEQHLDFLRTDFLRTDCGPELVEEPVLPAQEG